MVKNDNRKRHRYFLRESSYLKRMCRRLNDLIPCEDQKEIDEMSKLLEDVFDHNREPYKFQMYWDREVFIRCGSTEKAENALIFSGKLHFEPSDDPWEHPGITVHFNRKLGI